MADITFVDKKKRIILCNECEGTGKMLDKMVYEYTLGTTKKLIPCWICEGTGTLKLRMPKKESR